MKGMEPLLYAFLMQQPRSKLVRPEN